jgi:hypothetical protein
MNQVLAEPQSLPAPVRLRAESKNAIGTTAFFRNRALLSVLLQRLAALQGTQISVLVHACSIGAEVWSLAIATQLDPRLANKELLICASDLEPEFVAFAQRGIYPRAVLSGMQAAERACFDPLDDQNVQIKDALRGRVRFLPAESIAAFEPDRVFDVVVLLNALLYMPAADQSLVIDRVARYNRHLLVTTGFHFDRIKPDMLRNGYRPVGAAARAIHDGWLDRRRDVPLGAETIPGKIFHLWSLPPYREIEDFDYKYCALFEKRG